MIWQLVRLDANVDVAVLLLASDAKLSRIGAWILSRVGLRARASWAHHLTSTVHLSALVIVQIDRRSERVASVVKQAGNILAIVKSAADADGSVWHASKHFNKFSRHSLINTD